MTCLITYIESFHSYSFLFHFALTLQFFLFLSSCILFFSGECCWLHNVYHACIRSTGHVIYFGLHSCYFILFGYYSVFLLWFFLLVNSKCFAVAPYVFMVMDFSPTFAKRHSLLLTCTCWTFSKEIFLWPCQSIGEPSFRASLRWCFLLPCWV